MGFVLHEDFFKDHLFDVSGVNAKEFLALNFPFFKGQISVMREGIVQVILHVSKGSVVYLLLEEAHEQVDASLRQVLLAEKQLQIILADPVLRDELGVELRLLHVQLRTSESWVSYKPLRTLVVGE